MRFGQWDSSKGESVSLNTTNFDSTLSPADDTVQKAMDTLDDASGGASASLDTSSFDGILSVSDNTVQKAMDTLDDHTHASLFLSGDAKITALTNGVQIGGGGGILTLGRDGTDVVLDATGTAASDFVVTCGAAKTLELTTVVWDDLRVPVTSTTSGGSNPPTLAQFANDGVSGSGAALEFDSSNDETIQIPSNSSLTFDVDGASADKPFTIGFMLYVPIGYSTGHIIQKAGDYWRVDLRGNGRLRFRCQNINVTTPNSSLNIGAINNVVITVNALDASGTDVEIYIDDNLITSDSTGNKLTDSDGVVNIASRNSNSSYPDIQLDELRIWDGVLSAANITAFYNNGAGTESSIATEICGYHFNEDGGTDADNFEGTAALDIDFTDTGNDPAWITGFISAGSRGVTTYFFDPDENEELHFTAQFLHSRKTGSDIIPHVHWSPSDTDTGTVRWGLEYTWIDINGTFGNTTTIYAEDAGDGTANKHQLAGFSAIDGSGIIGVSSMCICRIFRDATHANDTYTGQAALLEIDFHFEIDTMGSRQETVK